MSSSKIKTTPAFEELLRRNLLWFAGGLLVTGIVGTAAAHVYVDGLIDKKIKSEVSAGVPGDAVGFIAMFKGSCPEGWTLYQEAQGRMPVGAGTHKNADEREEIIPSYPPEKTGGEVAHVLTIPEMPSHNHGGIWGGSLSVAGMTGDNQEHTSGHLQIQPNGGGMPHNNIPPYIALTFCVKAPNATGQN